MENLPKNQDEKTGQAPCVIYAAKSTEDKRGSIINQIEDCRAMADREGWEVVAEYSDEGFSAYTGNRGRGLEDAKAHAAAIADERGTIAMLAAQHSDRLARGAGDAPGASNSLTEIWHSARRQNVHLRSVINDFELSDPVLVAVAGKRDYEDSRRKGENVQRGLRRSAERGEWAGGILIDGYRAIYSHEDGRMNRTIVNDPDRKPIWDLVWDLARAGYSANAIVSELDKRRFVTAPRKKAHKPRPFDANRVRLGLNNPAYAGLSAYKGKVVADGQWKGYVTPEDFYRLRDERRERAHVEHRTVGRPVENYLLAGLGRCHECGGRMDTVNGGPRKDGSRPLRYTCRLHRERAWDCDAKPFDALAVDDGFYKNLPFILADVKMLDGTLAAARDSNRGRLEAEARLAREDREKAAKAKDKMSARVAALYADGEDTKAEALEDALGHTRQAERAADIRLTAALDAMSAMPEDEAGGEGYWLALRDKILLRIDNAGGDVKRLNIALTEFIESVTLRHLPDGQIYLHAQLRPEVVARLVRDRAQLDLDPFIAKWAEVDPESILGSTGVTTSATANPRTPW